MELKRQFFTIILTICVCKQILCKQILCKQISKPTVYCRYVDDTFSLFHKETEFQKFLNCLNSLHPSLKFTNEIETNNSLPFLDVLVTKSDNKFITSVYRKPLSQVNIFIGIPLDQNNVKLLLLLSASPYSGSPQRDSNLHFTRSTSSPSLAPTLSMSSLNKSIHLLLGLPLFLLPGTAISIILFPT